MNSDPFDTWLKQASEKKSRGDIPPRILERLPRKVVERVHEERRTFYLTLFGAGLLLLLGTVALTVVLWKPETVPLPVPAAAPLEFQEDATPTENSSEQDREEEEIVATLEALEESRLWQLGPDIYSANLEALDWVAVGR